MMNVLYVALGSALGGLSRYYVGIWVTNLSGARTLGTVLINVIGSLAIGLFLTLNAGGTACSYSSWLSGS